MLQRCLYAATLFVFLLSPLPVRATEDSPLELLEQQVAVSTEPPQASAEALLTLPSVYVLPGSVLYWFKQLFEDIHLMLTSDPEQRSQLLLEFGRERLAEGYQAMKDGNWEAALAALKRYQGDQADLAKALEALQVQDADVRPLIERLKEQLGLQQALGGYAEEHAPESEKPDLEALLRIDEVQTLALVRADGGALLGVRDAHQATPSASASATPSATPVERK